MKNKLYLLVIISSLALAQSGDNYIIKKSLIANGGGFSSGGNYLLAYSLGQHNASAIMTGNNYQLNGGFWSPSSSVDVIFKNSFENYE